ncbi:hypothetical protein [Streptomyces sp. NBC_00203]
MPTLATEVEVLARFGRALADPIRSAAVCWSRCAGRVRTSSLGRLQLMT